MLESIRTRNAKTKMHDNLFEFIAEKSRNTKIPLRINELCNEFIDTWGYPLTKSGLQNKVRNCCPTIHEMENFDTDTKVKMLFALSVPVDFGFLVELKKQAHIELDNFHRIIKYKKKQGDKFVLSGEHGPYKNHNVEIDESLLRFLAEKSINADAPIFDNRLVEEFKNTIETGTIRSLQERYRHAKKTIYDSTDFDDNIKIRMLFVSGAKLHDYVLDELRKKADVEVDDQNRITEYKAHDESLQLKGGHCQSAINSVLHIEKWQRMSRPSSDEVSNQTTPSSYEQEMPALINYAMEKCQNVKSPWNVTQLCRDFKTECGSLINFKLIYRRMTRFRQNIHKMNDFETEMKVKLLFGLGVSVNTEFLKKIRKDAAVEVDRNYKITKYSAKDGSLELEGDHSFSTKVKNGYVKLPPSKNCSSFDSDSSDSDDDADENVSTNIVESSRKRRSDSQRNSGASPMKQKKIFESPTKSADVSPDLESDGYELLDSDDSTLSEPESQIEIVYETHSDVAVIRATLEEVIEHIDKENHEILIQNEKENNNEHFMNISEYEQKKQKLLDSFCQTTPENDNFSLVPAVQNTQDMNVQEESEVPHEPATKENETHSDITVIKEVSDNIDGRIKERCSIKHEDEVLIAPIEKEVVLKQSHSEVSMTSAQIPTLPINHLSHEQTLFSAAGTSEHHEFADTIETFTRGFKEEHMTSTPFKSNEDRLMKFPLTHSSLQEQLDNFDENLFDLSLESVSQQIEPIDYQMYLDDATSNIILTSNENYQRDPAIHKILESVHILVVTLDLPELEEIEKAIREKMESAGFNETIGNDGVILAFESCLFMVMKNSSHLFDTKSISLREFLLLLRSTVLGLKLPFLECFQQKLKEDVGELRVANKTIEPGSIRNALQTLVDILIAP